MSILLITGREPRHRRRDRAARRARAATTSR